MTVTKITEINIFINAQEAIKLIAILNKFHVGRPIEQDKDISFAVLLCNEINAALNRKDA